MYGAAIQSKASFRDQKSLTTHFSKDYAAVSSLQVTCEITNTLYAYFAIISTVKKAQTKNRK